MRNPHVDLSWYTRYRGKENPDSGAIFKGPFSILNEPAIPLNDTDTLPQRWFHRPQFLRVLPRIQAIARLQLQLELTQTNKSITIEKNK